MLMLYLRTTKNITFSNVNGVKLHNMRKYLLLHIFIISFVFFSMPFIQAEENKCRNYCCTMFIKAIGVIIKHEGKDKQEYGFSTYYYSNCII